MLSALQQFTSATPRFDRNQVVLEILSREAALATPAALRIARSADPGVTIAGRLPPEQGGGYLVSYQGRSLSLPLRGDYTAGQVVRLALAPAGGPAADAAPAALPAVSITLGTDARLINSLLAKGAELPTGAPLLLAPAEGASTSASPPAAATLKQALSESGVFYEAHLAEWVQGERTIEQLRREPQGRLNPAAEAAQQDDALATAAVPGALVPIVKEQLQALDARQIGWRGEIWPRQSIELTIAEQDAGTREQGTAALWRTHMKLDLPQLGGVEAVLQMQGDALRISLRARPQSSPVLKENGTELAASLAVLGLKLVSMRVENHVAQTA